MSKLNRNRGSKKSKGQCRCRKIVEVTEPNPYFNFLKCLRARRPKWSSTKLAIEGVTLWCTLSFREKLRFDRRGNEIKKCYQFRREMTTSKSKYKRSKEGMCCLCITENSCKLIFTITGISTQGS